MTTLSVANEETVANERSADLAALRKLARRLALTSAGAVALAYDTGKSTLAGSSQWLDKAEQRGEEVQQDVAKLTSDLENQATSEAKKLRESISDRLGRLDRQAMSQADQVSAEAKQNAVRMTEEAKNLGKSWESQIQQQVEQVLLRLGIPTRDQLEQIGRDINELSAKLDTYMARLGPAASAIPPLPDYDALNAKDILAQMPALTLEQLESLRAYEVDHANRVTVLREVDDQIGLRLQAN
jgi:hypothetical protein